MTRKTKVPDLPVPMIPTVLKTIRAVFTFSVVVTRVLPQAPRDAQLLLILLDT